jgi:hypothetical protein
MQKHLFLWKIYTCTQNMQNKFYNIIYLGMIDENSFSVCNCLKNMNMHYNMQNPVFIHNNKLFIYKLSTK